MSSTQQVLDRWSAQVQDTVHAVEKDNKSVGYFITTFQLERVRANASEQKMTDFYLKVLKVLKVSLQ